MKTKPAHETATSRMLTDATPVLLQRRTMLFGCAVVLVALLCALAGASTTIVLAGLLTEGLLLLLWLLAAAGYGSLALRSLPPSPLRSVSSIALGLGLLSLVELLLGLAGVLHRGVAFAILAVGVVLLIVRCRSLTRRDIVNWLTARIDWQWLLLLAMPAFAIAIVAAYVPPGVLWGDEPHGYDVLEYHLQLPREWYEFGQVVPLTHNVFSYFPLATEMHYLLAMQLTGGPWAGMYLAQLMHVSFCALTVFAVYGVARQFAAALPATLAAVACANVPWMTMLAPVAYNEGALLLFATLAVGWLLHDRTTARPWIITGVFAGFACGAKLTAVPQVLVLVPLVAVIIGLIHREAPKWLALRAVLLISVGAIAFSPWLLRNLIWSGNPVFPEAQSLLGRAHFSPTQTERWQLAHKPPLRLHSPDARHREVFNQIVREWKFGYVLLPFGALCTILSFRNPASWIILALLALWLVFWIGFTHLQGRFYVLAIPIAAMGIATLRKRWQHLLAGGFVLAQVAIGLILLIGVFNDRVGPWSRNGILAVSDFNEFLPPDVADLMTSPKDIALVGDARAFLYQIPVSRLRYRTVFDVDVRDGETIVQAWLRGQEGSPAIVIDPVELERFSRTYYGIPPLPDDFPGPRDRAYILTPQH